MKVRLNKKYISAFVLTGAIVSLSQFSVFAETSDAKVVDVEICSTGSGEKTYVLKSDKTLWASDSDGTFSKVAEDVEKVFPESASFVGEVGILKTDGSLVLLEPSDEDYDESKYTITTDVLSTTDGNYIIIKEDNNAYKYDLISYEIGDGYKVEYKKTLVMEDVKKADIFSEQDGSLMLTNDGVLWYVDSNNKTKKVMENVQDFKIDYYDVAILDKKGNLYTTSSYGEHTESLFAEKDLVATGVKAFDFTSYMEDYAVMAIIKNDDSLWVKGGSEYGALGQGNDTFVTEEFVKVSDNVVDVEVTWGNLAYVTKDGKVFGCGVNANNQLGVVETTDEYAKYFDENGFHQVMTDVRNADLSGPISTAVKNDGTLWAFGYNVENQITNDAVRTVDEPIKIADDVYDGNYNYALGSINYVLNSDKSLHFTDVESVLYRNDYSENETSDGSVLEKIIIEKYIELLGLDAGDYEIYLQDEELFEKKLYEVYNKLTTEEQEALEEKIYNFLIDLNKELSAISYGNNVKMVSGSYYIDENNDVYKINIFDPSENEKIFTGAKYIYSDDYENDTVYIVDESGDLYIGTYFDVVYNTTSDINQDLTSFGEVVYTVYVYNEGGDYLYTDIRSIEERDTIKVEKLGVSDVKEVGSDGYDIGYIIKNNGTMVVIEEDYYSATNITKNDIIEINGVDFRQVVITNNAVTGSIGDYVLAYVDENGVLWGIGGSNVGDVELSYIEPTKIMEDVKKVCIDGESVLILKNDGTLLSAGRNDYGQLGFKAYGKGYSKTNVYTPTEIKVVE